MKIILAHLGHGSDVHKNKPKPENRDDLISQYFEAKEDEWWEFR
jgi:hypothetical protein